MIVGIGVEEFKINGSFKIFPVPTIVYSYDMGIQNIKLAFLFFYVYIAWSPYRIKW